MAATVDPTLWEAVATLVVERLENELCQETKGRLKKACRPCTIRVISEALEKIATSIAFRNGV